MADIEGMQERFMEAAMREVPQCRGFYSTHQFPHWDRPHAYCAIGWLAGGRPELYFDNAGNVGRVWPHGMTLEEVNRMIAANDEARLDWLTLARKLPEILSGEWTPEAHGG